MLLWYFLLLSNSSANSNSTLQFSFRHEFGWTIETENWFMGLHGNSWTFIENVERYQQTARNIHVLYRTNIARGILDLHHVNPKSNKQKTNKQTTNIWPGRAKWALGPKSGPTRFLCVEETDHICSFTFSVFIFQIFQRITLLWSCGPPRFKMLPTALACLMNLPLKMAHPDLKCYLRPFLVWWVCP